MESLVNLESFARSAELGSFSAAARRLGLTPAAVSRNVAALEASLKLRLFHRSTRSLNLTEAGERFLLSIRDHLENLQSAIADVSQSDGEPAGTLKISMGPTFGIGYILPMLPEFMRRYPRIEVELKLSDRFVELTDGAIDLAVRIGDLPDSALKTRRLGALRRVAFGAPEYFDRHGRPQHPDELAGHQCVVRTAEGEAWPFRVGGRTRTVRVSGRFRADNTAATYAAVAGGLGIGFTPLWQIRDLVDRGAVEPILTEYEVPKVPLHAVWPATRLPPAKTRLFVDFLAETLDLRRL